MNFSLRVFPFASIEFRFDGIDRRTPSDTVVSFCLRETAQIVRDRSSCSALDYVSDEVVFVADGGRLRRTISETSDEVPQVGRRVRVLRQPVGIAFYELDIGTACPTTRVRGIVDDGLGYLFFSNHRQTLIVEDCRQIRPSDSRRSVEEGGGRFPSPVRQGGRNATRAASDSIRQHHNWIICERNLALKSVGDLKKFLMRQEHGLRGIFSSIDPQCDYPVSSRLDDQTNNDEEDDCFLCWCFPTRITPRLSLQQRGDNDSRRSGMQHDLSEFDSIFQRTCAEIAPTTPASKIAHLLKEAYSSSTTLRNGDPLFPLFAIHDRLNVPLEGDEVDWIETTPFFRLQLRSRNCTNDALLTKQTTTLHIRIHGQNHEMQTSKSHWCAVLPNEAAKTSVPLSRLITLRDVPLSLTVRDVKNKLVDDGWLSTAHAASVLLPRQGSDFDNVIHQQADDSLKIFQVVECGPFEEATLIIVLAPITSEPATLLHPTKAAPHPTPLMNGDAGESFTLRVVLGEGTAPFVDILLPVLFGGTTAGDVLEILRNQGHGRFGVLLYGRIPLSVDDVIRNTVLLPCGAGETVIVVRAVL